MMDGVLFLTCVMFSWLAREFNTALPGAAGCLADGGSVVGVLLYWG